MEDAMRRSSHESHLIKEEKGDDNSSSKIEDGRDRAHLGEEDLNSSSPQNKDLTLNKTSNKGKALMESDSKKCSSSQKNQDHSNLESARAQVAEVREENERIKMHLDRIMKDYKTLQMRFHCMIQKAESNSNRANANVGPFPQNPVEESELVSLSLGRPSTFSNTISEPKDKITTCSSEEEEGKDKTEKEGLSLGLDCKFQISESENAEDENSSPTNSDEEKMLKEEGGETWPPSKALKTMRTGDQEKEVGQSNPAKKARVSVRVRCDTPTMNDGCQWRKYGQKISKGNPCPRAYYRCTVAPSCPVRKQVQRCASDMSILITTYEGSHNHPLPISATAMASTTSAAASMLLSGPSSSTTRPGGPNPTTIPRPELQGLNFYTNPKYQPALLHNSPVLSTSTSNTSHPTITLDLTTTPYNKFASSTSSNYPRFGSTSLNFTTSNNNTMLSWGNNNFTNGLFHNNVTQLPCINSINDRISLQLLQNLQNPNNINVATASHQEVSTDTIAAATKAIASDPSFQSALASALTTIIGTTSGTTTPNNPQQGSSGLMFLPPHSSLSFASPKSASNTPPSNKSQ